MEIETFLLAPRLVVEHFSLGSAFLTEQDFKRLRGLILALVVFSLIYPEVCQAQLRHRIIADEFHELIGAAVDGEHPFNEAKHQLSHLQADTRPDIEGGFPRFFLTASDNGHAWAFAE